MRTLHRIADVYNPRTWGGTQYGMVIGSTKWTLHWLFMFGFNFGIFTTVSVLMVISHEWWLAALIITMDVLLVSLIILVFRIRWYRTHVPGIKL